MKKLLILTILFLTPACASVPLVKPVPLCDPSRFDMKTLKGRMAHSWCEVKQDAKKL